MSIALWIAQGLLAVLYGMAGILKAFQTTKAKEQLPGQKIVRMHLFALLERRNYLARRG